MSFFDENLSVNLKKNMALEIFKTDEISKCKKYEIRLDEIDRLSEKYVDFFINSNSLDFF